MSDLIIEKRENLGFVPEVVGYLASIKEFEYSYKDYNLRHPGAVFNISAKYVVEDFIELLKELEENQRNYSRGKSDLWKKLRNLINDFFKFRDSCYEVIVGCCKKHKPPFEKQFLWRWLQENKYKSQKEFFDKTKDEVEFFEKIYNRLKHSSNAIHPADFFDNKSAIMGFYVEAVDDEGGVGPDENIHPKYHGQRTANSFNFILRRLYYLLYKISDILKEVIINHFKDVYDLNLPFNSSHNKSSDKYWKELYERMSRLPNAYFPNEFRKEVYNFKESGNKLIFTKTLAESTNLHGWQMDAYGLGDGFTRIYGIALYLSK